MSTPSVVLSDRWHHLTRCGLRVGSPDVGFDRVELVGTVDQWRAARAIVAEYRASGRGPEKTSATAALQRIDAMLSWVEALRRAAVERESASRLAEVARHDGGCRINVAAEGPCDCGLADALRGAAS